MTEDISARLYDELRRLAGKYLQGTGGGPTLQPTALVHEAWIKLEQADVFPVENPQHFLALTARSMRQVLVDHARAKGTAKRGGHLARITMCDVPNADPEAAIDVLDLDAALERLAAMNPERARLVELRFFGGATLEQVAEVLGISVREASRRWRTIRAWLASELRESEAP